MANGANVVADRAEGATGFETDIIFSGEEGGAVATTEKGEKGLLDAPGVGEDIGEGEEFLTPIEAKGWGVKEGEAGVDAGYEIDGGEIAGIGIGDGVGAGDVAVKKIRPVGGGGGGEVDSVWIGEEKKVAIEEENARRVAGGDEIEDLATEGVGSAQLTAAGIRGEECEGVWSLDGAADKPEAGEVGGESGAGGRWKGSVFMDDEGVANGREVVERLEGPDKVTPVGGGGEGVDFAGALSGNRDGGSGKNTVAPAEPAPSGAGTLAADGVEFAPRTEDRAPERLDEGTEHGEEERLDEISERAFRRTEIETAGD